MKIPILKIRESKFSEFKFWQYLALVSGLIIAVIMALASISYNSTLGTSDPAFGLVPISNKVVFEGLALAFDLGMVASVFGFWHWWRRNRVAAVICAILFVIASAFSVHSVRGYIALNVTKSRAPMERNIDVYASLKLELVQAQNHLAALQAALIKARGRKRTRLLREVARQSRKIQLSRNTLAKAEIEVHVTPLRGLDWFLALILWFFNATCWTAWFGTNTAPRVEGRDKPTLGERDSVSEWLLDYDGTNPEHCTRLYEHYHNWCTQHSCAALVQYSFYARLIELGGEKFRKNGNGATCYRLPQVMAQNDKLGHDHG